MTKNDFTRKRVQSFSGTLVFMMNMIRKSLSVEIANFVNILNNEAKNLSVQLFTKSAFSQARKKIKPEVFKELSENLVDEFYSDNDASVKLWNGFRILAVDGSRLSLPNTKELQDKYGISSNQQGVSVAQARLSVLYDVLNGFVIDGVLSPLSIGEQTLAYEHAKLTRSGDLVIYDRGYPSFNLIYEHNKTGSDFLIRAKIDFSTLTREFYESGKKSYIVDMKPGKNVSLKDREYGKQETIKVRFVRVKLDSGEDEILITSLLSSELYPDSIFKDLYYMRWRVETYYNEFKNNLRAGIFSGYSDHAIQQDFRAALFISNLHNLIVSDVDEDLAKHGKKKKYVHKVNRNTSYGYMKNKVISIFFSDKEASEITKELRVLFLRDTVPIRPDRKFERKVGKYRNKIKPLNIKNHKDTI